MPTFEVPDGPTQIDAPRGGDPKNPQPAMASAVYSVTNTTSDSVDGRLGVVVSGSSKSEWFTVDGDRERVFAGGETQTATIRVSFPPDVPAGEYPFRLRVIAINDPDNDHVEGPVTTAKLGGQQTIIPPPSRLWLWILLGVLAAIAIGVGIYFALPGDPSKKAAKRATEWGQLYAQHDVDGLSDMADMPFFLDDGAVLTSKSDVREKYRAMLQPGAAELPPGTDAKDAKEQDVGFERIGTQTIAQYRQAIGANTQLDQTIAAMHLADDDLVVIGDNQGASTILFFRRKGVKLAGAVN